MQIGTEAEMRAKLLGVVEHLKSEGVDLTVDFPVFKWSYPENPWIEFQLLIKETAQANLTLETLQ